jgi:hypothetical protein
MVLVFSPCGCDEKPRDRAETKTKVKAAQSLTGLFVI